MAATYQLFGSNGTTPLNPNGTKQLIAEFPHFPNGEEFFAVQHPLIQEIQVDVAFVYQFLNPAHDSLERATKDDGETYVVSFEVQGEYLVSPASLKVTLAFTKKIG